MMARLVWASLRRPIWNKRANARNSFMAAQQARIAHLCKLGPKQIAQKSRLVLVVGGERRAANVPMGAACRYMVLAIARTSAKGNVMTRP